MNFEDVPSEIGQTQTDKQCVIPLAGGTRSSTSIETESRRVAVKGWEAGGGMGSGCSVGRVSVWEDESVPEMENGDSRTTRGCTYHHSQLYT